MSLNWQPGAQSHRVSEGMIKSVPFTLFTVGSKCRRRSRTQAELHTHRPAGFSVDRGVEGNIKQGDYSEAAKLSSPGKRR